MSRSKFSREAEASWGRLRPDDDLSDLGVAQHLIWSGRLTEELLERAATVSGLSRRGDYEVLALLRRAEPALLTPMQVAQQLLTSPSSMTGKLDRLEQQGLIQRTPDLENRRVVNLGITDPGRTLTDAAFDSSLTVYRSILEPFTDRELKTIEKLLEKLLAQLEKLTDGTDP